MGTQVVVSAPNYIISRSARQSSKSQRVHKSMQIKFYKWRQIWGSVLLLVTVPDREETDQFQPALRLVIIRSNWWNRTERLTLLNCGTPKKEGDVNFYQFNQSSLLRVHYHLTVIAVWSAATLESLNCDRVKLKMDFIMKIWVEKKYTEIVS